MYTYIYRYTQYNIIYNMMSTMIHLNNYALCLAISSTIKMTKSSLCICLLVKKVHYSTVSDIYSEIIDNMSWRNYSLSNIRSLTTGVNEIVSSNYNPIE